MNDGLRKNVRQRSHFMVKAPRFEIKRDLIIGPETSQALEECISLFMHHETIYTDWGFAEVDPLGRAATVNFHGPPGTGKTMAAEALAGSLNMTFLALNIADLESSLKGEMAKNIQAAFEVAYEEGALLFFDEADALLGRRIAVSQGIDNDINATRNTFMTELNKHQGLVVFATNFSRDYDDAILSRITHQVYFALPDIKERRGLWSKMLVSGIPLAGDRNEIIEDAVRASQGLSGRDILHSMRRALPSVLMEAQSGVTDFRLESRHVVGAIEAIRRRYRKHEQAAKPEDTDPDNAGSLKRNLNMQ